MGTQEFDHRLVDGCDNFVLEAPEIQCHQVAKDQVLLKREVFYKKRKEQLVLQMAPLIETVYLLLVSIGICIP